MLRGPDQIRTGVGAFAELSLATRPQDPVFDVRFYPDIYRNESVQR
jgi:hypothetical protein